MANRRLQTIDGLLGPAVAATVKALSAAAEDAAAVRLAERYAATIDDAYQVAAQLAGVEPDDAGTARLIERLQAKVEAQAVLAELGPKLLATLEQLGATPAARAKVKAGGGPGGPSRLEAIRAARRPR